MAATPIPNLTFSEARKSLEAVIAETTRRGFVVYEFEARLALGEIEMKSGQATSGRARLAALEKQAAAMGFGLATRKAAASRGPA